jgi:hypothetical protein
MGDWFGIAAILTVCGSVGVLLAWLLGAMSIEDGPAKLRVHSGDQTKRDNRKTLSTR